MFGLPKTIKIQYGANINLKFNGELRDYQLTVLNEYLKAINFVSNDIKNDIIMDGRRKNSVRA